MLGLIANRICEDSLFYTFDTSIRKYPLTSHIAILETCMRNAAAGGGTPLTIESAGDGKLTVKAEIANGVRGFWYSLFSAESPAGPWEVVRADYESGTPVKQAVFEEASGAFTLAITVDPTASKRFFKLVVTEKDPSAE